MDRLLVILHGIIISQRRILLDPYVQLLRTIDLEYKRMEMLAIYFAIADNHKHFQKPLRKKRGRVRRVIINIRSDSKSTIEQLKGICEIRDKILSRIYERINGLLNYMSYQISFKYVQRTNNMAGLLLEKRRGEKKERFSSIDQIIQLC